MAEKFRGTNIPNPDDVDLVMGMDFDDIRTLGREVAQATAALEARRQERLAFDTLSPEAQMAEQEKMWHDRFGPREAHEVQPTKRPDSDFNNGVHAEFQQNRVPETVVFQNGAKNA